MPFCKAKKKNYKSKETSKNQPSKQPADKGSTESPPAPVPAPPATPAAPDEVAAALQTKKPHRPEEPRKKAKRNYFQGDDRYRTIVAAGLTTIAGGGGQVPTKDDAEHEKKVWHQLENWYITETYLLKDGSTGKQKSLEPDPDRMKEEAAAQKRLAELEKKFGETLMTALIKGQMSGADEHWSIGKLPAHTESTSLEDPRFEAQWW